MNFKKFLCSILAIAMMMSMMGTFVFAEDEAAAISEEAPEQTEVEMTEEPADEAAVQLLATLPTLYVNSDYTSETEGWGETHFANYASAYAYASVNSKNATIIIEKNSSLSGNTFDNNHKNCSKLAVVVQDGAECGNALSKWDMTYPVTVEPGGRVPSARPTSAGIGNSHIKNTLTVGAAGAEKKAVIDFHKGSYQDMSIAVLYNGKLIANNAIIKVADLGFTGAATINDSELYVKGIVAFGKNTWYKQTMTDSSMTVKGHNFMNEPTYYSTTGNIFNNLTMDNSTIVLDDEAEGTTVEPVTLQNLTMKNGSAMIIEEEATINITGKTTIENATLRVGDLTITRKGSLTIDNETLTAARQTAGVSADVIHIEEGGTLTIGLNNSLSASAITGNGTLVIDATEFDYTSGSQSTNLDLSGFSGTVNVINESDKELTVKVDENGIGVVVLAVAKIGDDKFFADFAEALSALGENETLTLLDNVTITEKWNTNPNDTDLDIDVPCTIDGGENKYTIKFACEIFDRNNYTAAFRATAPVTFKNLIIDMSGATHSSIWTRAISASSNLTVDNCTFIGNPNATKPVAIVYGEGATAVIDDVEVSINKCEFINWSRRTIGDNERGTDVKKVTVTGCTFNGSSVVLSASGEIVFTGNTLNDSNLSITSYTDKESLKATATGNTINESGTVAGLTYKVNAIGEGVSVQKEISTYVAKYNDVDYFDFAKALEAAKSAIAANETASRDILLYNNIADVNDDTLYRVYDEPSEGQVLITFDFGGGTNADGYVSESFILNYGEEINAPTDFSRDGHIFRGWDKEVQKQAYAPTTYTAVWVSEEDYGFKTVLTPVGGTKVSGENAIKIDPKGSFLIEVSIEDLHGDAPWNVAEVTMDYDNKLFTWNQNSSSVEAVDENTLRFKIYGADKVDGKVVKQLSFTAKSDTPDDYSGAFKVTEATVDTGWAANTIDATPAEAGEATVYIFYSFSVALGDGLSGAPTATTDKDYTGQIVGYDDEYNYVMTGTSGKNPLSITFDNTGKFTVTKDQIVGDMVISVEKTGLKGITADDVELYEYVADKYVLVLLNADKDRVYTYNGSLMYLTPHYDTVAGEKVHYGYLVKGTDFTADAAGSLNTEENKALALAKIGRHKTAAANLSLGNAEVGDVNNTGKLDVNDIQAVWNCYNVEEGNDGVSVNVNMPLYLRSDICGHNAGGRDKKVDSADVNAVRAMYDCEKNGGEVKIETALANDTTDGYYSITLTNGTTTTELAKAIFSA